MINIDGFSKSSLELVNNMLYAEGQQNPYEGKCGQKKLREQQKRQRTPAQMQADKERAQANRNKDSIPSGVRSEAAKKAAVTRRRCRGQSSPSSGVK